MRKTSEDLLTLFHIFPDLHLSHQLETISQILDKNPRISSLVIHDLCDKVDLRKGASGLSAEVVLRCAIVRQLHGFSYELLAFHLADSQTFRSFVRLPMGWLPNDSTLQRNISRISDQTWQEINQLLVGWAEREGLENGQTMRMDSTAIESNIHHPTDSELLYDSVRTVSRLLQELQERQQKIAADLQESPKIVFSDHTRRAKRRAYGIRNSRGRKREVYYRDLLKVTRKTCGYGLAALQITQTWKDPQSQLSAGKLKHFLDLMSQVIDQTQRRVVGGEKVAAEEKVVSIFEEHTDIIKKGGRESTFGHKVFLTTGKS